MIPLLTVTVISLLSMSSANQQNASWTVEASGVGGTVVKARDEALYEAMRMATGAIVTVESTLADDDYKEKIITYADASIEKYVILSESHEDDSWVVTLLVDISPEKIRGQLKKQNVELVKFDGAVMQAQANIKDKQRKNAKALIEKALSDLESIVDVKLNGGHELIDAEGGSASLKVPMTISANTGNYQIWLDKYVPWFRSLSLAHVSGKWSSKNRYDTYNKWYIATPFSRPYSRLKKELQKKSEGDESQHRVRTRTVWIDDISDGYFAFSIDDRFWPIAAAGKYSSGSKGSKWDSWFDLAHMKSKKNPAELIGRNPIILVNFIDSNGGVVSTKYVGLFYTTSFSKPLFPYSKHSSLLSNLPPNAKLVCPTPLEVSAGYCRISPAIAVAGRQDDYGVQARTCYGLTRAEGFIEATISTEVLGQITDLEVVVSWPEK
jgi:hypothetical protein